MPALSASPDTLARTVAEGRSPEVLDAIWSPGCAAAIWHRRPGRQVREWLDALAAERLPSARLVLKPERVGPAMESLFDTRGIADSPCRAWLIADIVSLASLFARVMASDLVSLRLDVVNNNACTKFHLDNVSARILCTYRGRGTEYGESRNGEEPRSIHTLATGSVGLFRGKLWPSPEPSAIAHRSPPIAGSGKTRLLLVINPLPEPI